MLKKTNESILLKGFAILSLFLIFSFISNALIANLDPVSFSRYQSVDIENLARYPLKYDGMDISSSGDIKTVVYDDTSQDYIIEIEHQIVLIYQNASSLIAGMHISFRGRCTVTSSITVTVDDIHVWDLVPYILTVPGVIFFTISFFYVYKVDWKNLSFVPRRKGNA
ncbi:MAG: hypothetical protein ACTSP4_01430 [Candidatus Hodarchaeales archaeon]